MTKQTARPNRAQSGWLVVARRVGAALVVTAAAVVQIPGCSVKPFHASPGNPAIVASAPPQGKWEVPAPPPGRSSADFSACREHFPGYVPNVPWPGRQRAVCFTGFAVLYSGESKTPVYSVERLTGASIAAAKSVPRIDRFYPEARLPAADRAQLADYARSGYDRGHMAPAGDMPSPESKAQSFSLANMVPQAKKLNERDWSRIEGATRKYAARSAGEVFVFTGPAFDRPAPTIGPGQVWVPRVTWKVVYSRAEGRAWAYWMENTNGEHSLQPIAYDDFVRRSGIALLAPDTRD